MALTKNDPNEERVLVLAPTGRDAALTCEILKRANIASDICRDIEEVCRGAEQGAGVILLAEEALNVYALHCLNELLAKQPAWSDLPLVVFSTSTESSAVLLRDMASWSNVSILERPISITIVISALQSAIRARRRQYQMRDVLLQMEEAHRQKDLFLATLSHELRTPLNSMLGWLTMLRQGKLDQADTERALETIDRNARAQAQMIVDILDVSRIITGKFQLDSHPMELAPLIDATIATVWMAAQAKKIALRVKLDPDAGLVHGDANRLQQVMWNLLINAIKFTPNAGRVEVRLQRRGALVEIKVSDTGQGIDPEVLPYIFDRFRQADNSYQRKHGGLGLGLAIVRHIVELHGGRVSAESLGEGQGASFTVSLPAYTKSQGGRLPEEAGAGEVESPANSAPLPVAGLQVLLVEDDADSRNMVIRVLAEFGINVTAVSSSPEALVALQELKPDVLVSDIGMPGEDGYTLMRKVRQMEAGNGHRLPAIALSGYASKNDRSRAITAGFQMHIAKPIEIRRLVNAIAELAGRTAH